MFQDWENIPDFLISECSLHQETFRYFGIISDMNDESEAFEIFIKNILSGSVNNLDESLSQFDESYQGFFGSSMKDARVEYAYQYIENTGMLSNVPEALERYFNYEAFARDLFLDGYSEIEGHVFADY